MSDKPKLFMIIWDDEMGIAIPMAFDPDCQGAVCSLYGKNRVALFNDRMLARRAILISTKNAELCRAQGKPANADFLGEYRKNIRVVECETL